MNTIQLIFLILVLILTISFILIFYFVIRIGKKASYRFDKLFSKYDLTLKKNFYMAAFYDEVYDFLSDLEFRNGIRLSEEAKQMLILPLIEIQRINRANRDSNTYERENFQRDFGNWQDSVRSIIENIKFEPAQIDRNNNFIRTDERSSISVIKAYANRFCKIPPFCGER